MTVEMSLIFPLITLVLVALIYIIVILSTETILQSEVHKLAEESSRYLSGQCREQSGSGMSRLYFKDYSEKATELENFYSKKYESHYKGLLINDVEIKVEVHSNLFKKEIRVYGKKNIHLPLLSLIGLKDKAGINVKASRAIERPKDFILNTDFGVELLSKQEYLDGWLNEYNDIIDHIVNAVQKVHN